MRLAWVGALIVLWGLPAWGEPLTGDNDSLEQMQRAKRAFQSGLYGEAWKLSRPVPSHSLSGIEDLLAKGEIAEVMGEFDEAHQAYSLAEAMDADHPRVLYRRASLAVRLGRYKKALHLLERVVARQELSNIDPIVQFIIDIHLEEGDLERARKLAWERGILQKDVRYCVKAKEATLNHSPKLIYRHYRLASLAHPRSSACISLFGMLLIDTGFLRMARTMILEGLRTSNNPDFGARVKQLIPARLSGGREVSKHVEQLSLIGRERYLREGDVQGAVSLFSQAMALDPKFDRPYVYMAELARDQNDLDAEVMWLDRAIRADPNSWSAHRAFGKAHLHRGHYTEAEVHLRKSIELYDHDVGSRLVLAHVLYAQGKLVEYAEFTRSTFEIARLAAKGLPKVRRFLRDVEQGRIGEALPPMPDPRAEFGWRR